MGIDRFYIGGANSDWGTATNWAASSGGDTDNTLPANGDIVFMCSKSSVITTSSPYLAAIYAGISPVAAGTGSVTLNPPDENNITFYANLILGGAGGSTNGLIKTLSPTVSKTVTIDTTKDINGNATTGTITGGAIGYALYFASVTCTINVISTTITGGSSGTCAAIQNAGTSNLLTVTGNVYGGSTTNGYGVSNSGTSVTQIIGDVHAMTANGINGAAGTVRVKGDVYGSTTTAIRYGINITNTGTAVVIGNVYGGTMSSACGISVSGPTAVAIVSGTINGGEHATANGIVASTVTTTIYYMGADKLIDYVGGATAILKVEGSCNQIVVTNIQKNILKTDNWSDANNWVGGVPANGSIVCLTAFPIIMDVTNIPPSANDSLTAIYGVGHYNATYTAALGGLTVDLNNIIGARRINATNFIGKHLFTLSGSTYPLHIYGNIRPVAGYGLFNNSTGTGENGVTIHGDVYGASVSAFTGIWNNSSGTINIYGDIISGDIGGTSHGVCNYTTGTINAYDTTISCSAYFGSSAHGIINISSGNINITDGYIYGGTGNTNTSGIYNTTIDSTITAIRCNIYGGGSASAAGCCGINNVGAGTVIIQNANTHTINSGVGSAGGNNGIVNAAAGSIDITGDIIGNGMYPTNYGVYHAGGTLTIVGNLLSQTSVGVKTTTSSAVTITGNITAGTYPALWATANATIAIRNGTITASSGSYGVTLPSAGGATISHTNVNLINSSYPALSNNKIPVFVDATINGETVYGINSWNYIQYGTTKFAIPLTAGQVYYGIKNGENITGTLTSFQRNGPSVVEASITGAFI